MKVLLSSFHLNGHTLGFHPQTQKIGTTLHSIKEHHKRVFLLNVFEADFKGDFTRKYCSLAFT